MYSIISLPVSPPSYSSAPSPPFPALAHYLAVCQLRYCNCPLRSPSLPVVSAPPHSKPRLALEADLAILTLLIKSLLWGSVAIRKMVPSLSRAYIFLQAHPCPPAPGGSHSLGRPQSHIELGIRWHHSRILKPSCPTLPGCQGLKFTSSVLSSDPYLLNPHLISLATKATYLC